MRLHVSRISRSQSHYTQPTGQLAQKTTFGYNQNIKAYPYDPAKAKSLLSEAGYPNGFKTKIDVPSSVANAQALFLLVQDQFKQVGIDAEIITSTDPAFNTDRIYGRVARNPLLGQGLVNSPPMDADFTLGWFGSHHPEVQRWYNDPTFDQVYQASISEPDEAKRAVLLQRASELLYEGAPWLFMVDGTTLWMASSNLSNVNPRGDGEPIFSVIGKR